jgi:hypothetical protein
MNVGKSGSISLRRPKDERAIGRFWGFRGGVRWFVSSFSPEFRLVVACAMWPPSARRTEAIGTAAAGPLDWTCFLPGAPPPRPCCFAGDCLMAYPLH